MHLCELYVMKIVTPEISGVVDCLDGTPLTCKILVCLAAVGT